MVVYPQLGMHMDMKSNIPTLKNWVQYHNVLLGDAWYHPKFENGTRIISNHIGTLDHILGVAKCAGDETWLLKNPGKIEDYYYPKKSGFLESFYEETKDTISDIKKQLIKLKD